MTNWKLPATTKPIVVHCSQGAFTVSPWTQELFDSCVDHIPSYSFNSFSVDWNEEKAFQFGLSVVQVLMGITQKEQWERLLQGFTSEDIKSLGIAAAAVSKLKVKSLAELGNAFYRIFTVESLSEFQRRLQAQRQPPRERTQ